jgi:hypothetical protein
MNSNWNKPFSFDIAKQYSPTSSGGAPMIDPASMAFAGLGAVGNAVGGIFSARSASQQARQRAISDAMALRYKESEMFGGLLMPLPIEYMEPQLGIPCQKIYKGEQKDLNMTS